jgi:mRNA-degrading endonuclease RelE of RelBE toxin-antitoxin system
VTRTVLWSRPATKELKRLDRQVIERVRAAVRRLAQTGEGDVRKLVDTEPPEYRLRVGSWRVRFELVDEPDPAVIVLHVLSRGEAYH